MANEVKKVNTIAIADIKNINTQTDANIKELNGQEFTGVPPDWRGDRAIFGGVYAYTGAGSSLYLNEIHYKAINSGTDSADFGDLQETRSIQRGSGSTGTRTVMGGGYTGAGTRSANIDYTTVASIGTTGDAGDLDTAAYYGCGDGASNGVTCLFLGGNTASGVIDEIEEMNMASTGASDNGGEMRSAAIYGAASNGDSKSIILDDSPSVGKTELSAHNFVSGADATDSGNVLTVGVGNLGSCANATIVVFAGGYLTGYTATDTIQSVPVDSSSDSENEGDLVQIVYALSGTSNDDGTKGEFYGGLGQGGSPAQYIQDDIQRITFASLTNSADEGDLTFTVSAGTYTHAGGASYLSSQSGG